MNRRNTISDMTIRTAEEWRAHDALARFVDHHLLCQRCGWPPAPSEQPGPGAYRGCPCRVAADEAAQLRRRTAQAHRRQERALALAMERQADAA